MTDELLDVVNEKDETLGRELRSAVHARGLLHRGVHIFLATPDGRLLVQKRGRNQDTYPLALDCSVSEHVKAGEGYLKAARRGLWEELGLEAVPLRALVKFKMEYGPGDLEICQLYEGRADPEAVRFDPGEVEAVASYSLDELKGMARGGKTQFSSWLVELLNWYSGKPSRLEVLKTYPARRRLG